MCWEQVVSARSGLGVRSPSRNYHRKRPGTREPQTGRGKQPQKQANKQINLIQSSRRGNLDLWELLMQLVLRALRVCTNRD